MHQGYLLDGLVEVVVAYKDVLECTDVAEVVVDAAAACVVEYSLAVRVRFALKIKE